MESQSTNYRLEWEANADTNNIHKTTSNLECFAVESDGLLGESLLALDVGQIVE